MTKYYKKYQLYWDVSIYLLILINNILSLKFIKEISEIVFLSNCLLKKTF